MKELNKHKLPGITLYKKTLMLSLLLILSFLLTSCDNQNSVVKLKRTFDHYFEETKEYVDTSYHNNYTYDFVINEESFFNNRKYIVNCWVEYYSFGTLNKDIYLIKDEELNSHEGKITINLYDFGGISEKWSAYVQSMSGSQIKVYHKEYYRINPNANINTGRKVIQPLGNEENKEYNLNSPIVVTMLINSPSGVVYDNNIFQYPSSALKDLLLNENMYLIKVEFSEIIE